MTASGNDFNHSQTVALQNVCIYLIISKLNSLCHQCISLVKRIGKKIITNTNMLECKLSSLQIYHPIFMKTFNRTGFTDMHGGMLKCMIFIGSLNGIRKNLEFRPRPFVRLSVL